MEAGDFLFDASPSVDDRDLDAARLLLDLYKEMNYAYVAVGRRDLAAGVPFLKEGLADRSLVGLSANLTFQGEVPFEPYGLYETDGVKIGVIAVTAPFTGARPAPEGVTVSDPVTKIRELVTTLRDQVNLLVLLSNLGVTEDQAVAKEVKGIDIIVGSGPGGPLYRPIQIGKTALVRSHSKGRSVGLGKFVLDKERKVESFDNRLVLLAGDLPKDEDVADRSAKLAKPAGAEKARSAQPGAQTLPEDNPFLKALRQKIEEQKTSGKTGLSRPPNGRRSIRTPTPCWNY